MSKLPVIAVAAVLSTALALPAVAQSSSYTSGATRYHQMSNHHAHHHAMHAHHMHHRHQAHMQPGYADRGYGWDGGRSGFLGGAVTTAGAIATAPFGGPATVWGQPYGQPYGEAYGFDRAFLGTWHGYGYNGGRLSPEYVKRNAMACVPGTVIKGASDGRPHLCQ